MEKIVTVLIATIKIMVIPSNSTRTTIIQIEKPLKSSSLENTKDVHVGNQAAQKNTANAIRQVCYAEIFANVLNARTTSLLAIRKLSHN